LDPLGVGFLWLWKRFHLVRSGLFHSYPKELLAGTHIRLRGGDLKALLRWNKCKSLQVIASHHIQ
jgi:hypothetical protein